MVPTTFEFTDIAGIVKGASKGEGLGNKFLENIRQVDAIVHVVRAFDDDNITHVADQVDPVADIETINLELSLADLDAVDKRLAKVTRAAKGSAEAKAELAVLEKLKPALEAGGAVRDLTLDADEQQVVKGLFLLTSKPVLYVANISEDSMADPTQDHYFQAVQTYAEKHGAQAIGIAAESEEEIAELDEADKQEFLQAAGVKEPGLDKLIRAAYRLLNLETFFTAGGKETKAWTFLRGTKAPQAAGIIHSDFERGFIRAEVMSFADLDQYESEAAVKEAGKLRVEGKDYTMQDGDIVNFRFNV